MVTDGDTRPLDIETDLAQLTPDLWYGPVRAGSFEAVLPSGWTGDTARVIVTMPGIVLVDEAVSLEDGVIWWELDAWELNQLANNFDYERGIADTIGVTFFADGTLAGESVQAVGTMVTHGARVPDAR